MNIEDTVKALRQCANEVTCKGCAFSAPGMTGDCRENMMIDAADQLERIQLENERLKAENKLLSEISGVKCDVADMENGGVRSE